MLAERNVRVRDCYVSQESSDAKGDVPHQRESWNGYLAVKATIDFLVALVLLLISAPVILVAAALVKLTSRGPAFYSQTRLGRLGRPYKIYKLRSMTHNCEKLSGARWSTPGDSRITRVGRVLRKSHIDELPQLWNVLKGDMSLIGPRPERPEFVPQLERAIPRYRERLNVRPGVSGLAQVQLPPDSDLDSVRRKLAYDLYYVQQVSFGLDLRIMAGTVTYLLGVPVHVSRSLLQMPGGEHVERNYQAPEVDAEVVPELQPA